MLRGSLEVVESALASLAPHAGLVAPAFWVGGAALRHSPKQKNTGEAALQWIVLDDSPKLAVASPAPPDSPVLVAIGLSDRLSTLPAASPGLDTSKPKESEEQSSLGEISGRYVGQIQARIERAWLRPRTAIGAPIFQCQVQVDHESDESQRAFQALRDAAIAPHAHRVLQLRIEGSKAEIASEH